MRFRSPRAYHVKLLRVAAPDTIAHGCPLTSWPQLESALTVALLCTIAGCASEPPPLEFDRRPDECSTDADCDDGLVCNGTEHCGTISHRCTSGTPMVCDDGIACTEDICLEPDASCGPRPQHDRCESGNQCDVDVGCVTACPGSAPGCDPVARCGCLEGDACYYGPLGAPHCEPEGTAGHTDPCDPEPSAECAAGSICIAQDLFVTPSRSDACRRLCRSDAECPGDSQCRIPLANIDDARACTQECDLFDQTGCDAPTGCHLLQVDDEWFTDCMLVGSRRRGEICVNDTECAAGTICVRDGASGVSMCLGLCLTRSDCEADEACWGFVEPIMLDGRSVGPCVKTG